LRQFLCCLCCRRRQTTKTLQYNETIQSSFFQDEIEVLHMISMIEQQMTVFDIVSLQHTIVQVLIYMLIEFISETIQEAHKCNQTQAILQYDDTLQIQVLNSFTNDICQLQLLRIKSEQKLNDLLITTK
jgi:hypothetical protein